MQELEQCFVNNEYQPKPTFSISDVSPQLIGIEILDVDATI